MISKWVVIILGITIGFLLVLGGFFFLRKEKVVSPIVEESQLTVPPRKLPSQTLKEYQDPSGFKFSYPQNLSVLAKEIEEKTVYSDLEITSKEASGTISLKVADSRLKSLADWFLENEEAITSAEVKDIKLAEVAAKEIRAVDKILTLALDQGALFTIEVIPYEEKDFWLSAYNTLLSTFSFALPEEVQIPGPQGPASSEIIFEGEEIID